MKIRTPWLPYLHGLRRREIEIVFSKCPKKLFNAGLELGAGDGFQSGLLAEYVSNLTSTDYGPDILKNKTTESINYRLCDAEDLEREFFAQKFDLVFSSSLLEHLPDPQKALEGISKVLRDEGITIHVIPSPFWKFCHVLLHVPNIILAAMEAVTVRDPFSVLLRKVGHLHKRAGDNRPEFGNNPKTQREPRSFVSRLLIPEPHGVSSDNVKEFYAFSKYRWKKEFQRADLELVRLKKGPVTSGYGFGLDFIRSTLEFLGATSEYIYVATKKGNRSPYELYI